MTPSPVKVSNTKSFTMIMLNFLRAHMSHQSRGPSVAARNTVIYLDFFPPKTHQLFSRPSCSPTCRGRCNWIKEVRVQGTDPPFFVTPPNSEPHRSDPIVRQPKF